MRLGFVSIDDPRNVRSWSGIPYHFLAELERQAGPVEVIGPLSRRFKYLYAPMKIVARLRGKSIQQDRHGVALWFYRRQLRRAMRGKELDAVICMSSISAAAIDPGPAVYFYTDAVIDGMAEYYPGDFANMSAGELRIAHAQEQKGLDRASVAAYSSHWAKRVVEERYERVQGKIDVIHFGASVAASLTREDVEALIAQRLAGPLNLLFVGVDWERKGGPLALEATRLLKARGFDVTLHVAGCAAPEDPLVRQVGFVDKSTAEGKAKFAELFREAAIFFLPTRAEAAGIVFAEASSFGVPIIASDTGGVADYVIDEKNGYALAVDASAAEYADRIEQVMRDRELYRRLALGGHGLFEERMTWAAAVSRMLANVRAGRLADDAQTSSEVSGART